MDPSASESTTSTNPSNPPFSASSDPITAITESLPPTTDYLTYLTILESHLSPEILPKLNEILQDAQLTQNIGWDLIHLLLPMPGGEKCLGTIARLGNPREVVLKVTEALQLLNLSRTEEDEEEQEDADEGDSHNHDQPAETKEAEKDVATESVEAGIEKPMKKVTIDVGEDQKEKETPAEPTQVDKFCILVNVLATIHPRIKTKYPSRFLSTSLMAILAAFRPSNQATLAVISFVHAISGKKRPALPERKSSMNVPVVQNGSDSHPSAPDPEAQDEDPREAAIQKKLLQSFVTHVLEDYINTNPLEWSARLQELFTPKKVVTGRKSLGESFREDPALQTRDAIVGQLVALARDLGLSDYSELLDAIHKTDEPSSEEDPEENYPTSPSDIPLSKAGSLSLITCLIFASVLFESKAALPKLSIFPDHAKLMKQFIGIEGPPTIGNESQGVIDAVLAIGLWLEHYNEFVSGPLEDEDFLQQLQSLSLLSANTPSPTLRYAAHALTGAILHAHPVDRLRLTFICDTLEHCPYETLKASAVSWLKDEIITAQGRKSQNAFATTVALAAAQPYLFPDTSALSTANDEELKEELAQSFSFHMAVVNFLFFISNETYKHVVPPAMMAVVEEIYLGPLRTAQKKALEIAEKDGDGKGEGEGEEHFHGPVFELRMLGDRIELASKQIDA
ncbi:hypothetical protein HYFRA_00009040 [Hymenoscyphus fraxineus]|uniref:DUF1760-domain-containing protein n=1 Tax=Hymenoscyphus fraxineus TaxID=746836 RepID=A0A9N9KRH7_9HELO|nr:hypothetical protein HYFRA_00009040 [Hymenoscyphus fraxineus]